MSDRLNAESLTLSPTMTPALNNSSAAVTMNGGTRGGKKIHFNGDPNMRNRPH